MIEQNQQSETQQEQYSEEKCIQRREQTTLEMIQDTYFNISYKKNTFFKQSIEKNLKIGSVVYFLGEEIQTTFPNPSEQYEQLKESIEYLLQLFQSTMWFTYRKVFPILINNVTSQDYISDTGWGCMIRAGQMILAQGLSKHLKIKLGQNIHAYEQIILAFADEDSETQSQQNDKNYKGSPYSIQNICKMAKYEFGQQQQPGQWYNPNRICLILEKLHNQKQMSGTENLKICTMNTDSPIIFESILKKFTNDVNSKIKCVCQQKLENENKEKENSQNQSVRNSNLSEFEQISDIDEINGDNKKSQNFMGQSRFEEIGETPAEEKKNNKKKNMEFSIISNECDTEDGVVFLNNKIDQQQYQNQIYCKNCHESKSSVIVFIGCKIGLNSPEEKYLKVVDYLLTSEYSIGMIGGKPQKALFFPGRIDKQYIFLDPHIVQQFTSNSNLQNESQLKTHFCKDFQTISQDQLDSCLALGFYLPNLEAFQKFYQTMTSLNQKYKEDNFIWTEETCPEYLIQEQEDYTCLVDYEDLGNNDNNNVKNQNIDGLNNNNIVTDQNLYFNSNNDEINQKQCNNNRINSNQIIQNNSNTAIFNGNNNNGNNNDNSQSGQPSQQYYQNNNNNKSYKGIIELDSD